MVTLKTNQNPPPTFERFVAQCQESYAFLAALGFTSAPLPQREYINQFQVRYANGKLVLIVEGINWGRGTITYFEDYAQLKVPLFLFIPREHRKLHAKPLPGEPQQLVELRSDAQLVREHCADLLGGDMTRFYDRASEWQRITGKDRPNQKRVLPP